MALTPSQKKEIHNCVSKLEVIALCERIGVINNLTRVLGCSAKTVRRLLKSEGGWSPKRKTRSDKGSSLVTEDFAIQNAGIIAKATRETGKRLLSFKQSLEILEANNILPYDKKTGEVKNVSANTLSRKMLDYGLHPKQLNRGTPAVTLRSLHPNHTWQIDASVCVLFYLPENKVEVLDEKVFYKNKPKNLEKISRKRIIRYVVTDHYSGFIYVRYELGDEDSMGIINTLIGAIAKRHESDPMHGVPKYLMLDKGAGNMSQLVKGFCENLKITMLPHATGNARASGQVECANNLVEKGFEGRLRFLEINNLEELQTQADLWRSSFNARSVHTRTKKTRSRVWVSIKEEELRTADKEVLQEISTWKDITRKINNKFQITVATKKYGQKVYALNDFSFHGLGINDDVKVVLNAFTAPAITVSKELADGSIIRFDVAPLEFDEAGFRVDAPVIGQNYASMKKTHTEHVLEQIEKVAYGVDTMEDVKMAKKQKTRPFQDIDFMADVKKSPLFMVTKGSEAISKSTEIKNITRINAAKLIREKHEELWAKNAKQSMSWLKNKYENLVPENEIEKLCIDFEEVFMPKIATVVDFEKEEIIQCVAG